MDVEKYFTTELAEEVRAAIAEADGNEVFFVGYVPPGTTVLCEVEVVARGNESSVPALMELAHRSQVVIHNHPNGRLTPSKADIEIASQLGQFGIGFLIINNKVNKLYEVVPVIADRKKANLSPNELLKTLDDDGLIARQLPNFESRPEQKRMLRSVIDAFNGDEIAVIEAGTGTGKSLAYLIPALHWALMNKERCVISTNTINLQEQLHAKDIPFIVKALDLPVQFCLVKGRGNYLCLNKLQSLKFEPDTILDDDEREEFKTLQEWSSQTDDGSKSDLNFSPSYKLWDKVCSESDTCLQLKCKHYGKCFLMKARRKANSADVLIVNHHLLFSDLAIRRSSNNFSAGALLPPYKRVIIDEAHNAEDAASSYLGEQITKLGLIRLLRRLYSRKNQSEKGILPMLRMRCRGKQGYFQIDEIIAMKVVPLIVEILDDVDVSFLGFFDFVRLKGQNSDGEQKVRIVKGIVESPEWQKLVKKPLSKLGQKLRMLYEDLKPLGRVLSKIDDENLAFDILQFKSNRDRIATWVATLNTILDFQDDGLVRWFEAHKDARWESAKLLYSPLAVGDILKETLYDNFATVVFTSATLTSGDNFGFIRSRLGLDSLEPKKVVELALPSSFDFKNQVLLCVPKDIPLPTHREFTPALIKNTLDLLTISQGRAFVLFTSFSLLNTLYNELKQPLLDQNIVALKQGSEDRHRLFQRFREDISSTLFGTDSFWEGVDAPGETLEVVILTRLPFRVPTEPLIEARVEAIQNKGGNPFMEFNVPQAVIKFKQGFGRLIRKKDDYGVIVVFDKRIVEKFYGKLFLQALPDCTTVIGTMNDVATAMQQFFNKRRQQ